MHSVSVHCYLTDNVEHVRKIVAHHVQEVEQRLPCSHSHTLTLEESFLRCLLP